MENLDRAFILNVRDDFDCLILTQKKRGNVNDGKDFASAGSTKRNVSKNFGSKKTAQKRFFVLMKFPAVSLLDKGSLVHDLEAFF